MQVFEQTVGLSANRKLRKTADSNFESEKLICRNLARMGPFENPWHAGCLNQEVDKPADDWIRPPCELGARSIDPHRSLTVYQLREVRPLTYNG